jgi:hypothetical protein
MNLCISLVYIHIASVYGLPWIRGFIVFLYQHDKFYNCVVLYTLSIYIFLCAGRSDVSFRNVMKDLFQNKSNTDSQYFLSISYEKSAS